MNMEQRMAAAQQLLEPYAVPVEGTLGRTVTEAPDATRFPFQRDRDRIVHTKEYRRLKGKTQVFVAGVGDHYRTRLTHTTEVALLSRDISRTLGLNEDLAECIALAHDLGHPPFGHVGEQALHSWMSERGAAFEHNQQSLRIVTLLAHNSALYKGLNLNIEVLEGLMKHRTPHDNPVDSIPRNPSLEAQVVNLADEIAYTGHDVDDGLREGLFTEEEISKIPLVLEAQRLRKQRNVNSALIDLLVTDLYQETAIQLEKQRINTLDDVYNQAKNPVRFSAVMRGKLDELRSFLFQQMYDHPAVLTPAKQGQIIISGLCEYLIEHPNENVTQLQQRNGGELYESVKDYVAGMTDNFATQSYNDEILKT